MTPRNEVRLVTACPACGGTGDELFRGCQSMVNEGGCLVCNGAGEVSAVVNCASCRWWNYLEEGWGTCLHTEVDGDTQKPTEVDALAYVWGESVSDHTALMTHASFGCNQWEERKP